MFSQDRTKQRAFLASCWQKNLNKEYLEPLEQQLVFIIQAHPEYHHLINDVNSEYSPEQGEINPFLHINLHLALKDQLSINQPIGINQIYQDLIKKYKDSHEVEHLMMECIAEMIYISQKNNTEIDEDAYLNHLKNLIN